MAKVRLQGNKNLINERLNAQVDWNTVGGQISANFEEAAAFRRNRIKEIEDATKELGKTVEDKPIGTNKYLNDFIFETSNVTASYAYQLNQMWKRGDISANEYKKKIHGLGSRVGGTFDAIKGVNENQQEIIKRSQEGKSSAFEMALAEKLLPFSNFNKLTPTISPKNGNLVFVTDDGQNVHIMDDRQFAAGMQFRSDKVNLNGLLAPRIEEAGIYINQYLGSDRSLVEFMSQTGDDSIPEGKERKKKVDQYLDSIADEILSNPYNTASILMDSIGGYDIALDQIPDGVDKEKFILTSIDDNGVVQIDTDTPEGKKQLKAARDEIKNRLAVMMDEKRRVVRTAPSPTSAEIKARGTREAEANRVKNWRDLAIGDIDTKEAAANSILGSEYAKKEGLLKMNLSEGGSSVTLEYTNPAKNREIDLSGDLSFGDYMRVGSEVTGVEDPDKAISMSGINPNQFSFNRDFGTGITVERAGQEEDPTTTYNRYIRDLDEEELSRTFKMTEKDATVKLNDILKGTGFTAERVGYIGKQSGGEIKIKNTKGETIATFDSGSNMSMDDINSNITELKNKLIGLTPSESKIEFVDSNNITSPNQNQKRTVSQIMEEDGVSKIEAIKIFNEQ
jgi:hypothetical protein